MEKCIKCGKKGTVSLMKDYSLDYYTCDNCGMDVRRSLWLVLQNSLSFKKFTWEWFFNKYNFGQKKEVKYP